jgi:carbonic anhydrase
MIHQALEHLLDNNRRWVASVAARDPAFFSRLVEQQKPAYMWIGCCDSRVPANEILGLLPGEVFVHRNIGNVVVSSDLNCMSAVEFAVKVLGIHHIMLTGHYGCGAVHASMEESNHVLVERWIEPIRRIQVRCPWINAVPIPLRRQVLCELNVIEQLGNLGLSTVITQAWTAGCPIELHGLIYDIADGRLRPLPIHLSRTVDVPAAVQTASEWVRNEATETSREKV